MLGLLLRLGHLLVLARCLVCLLSVAECFAFGQCSEAHSVRWRASPCRSMRATLALQLDAVRSNRVNEEFKVAASQTLCLKEAVKFTERWVLE